MKHAIPFEVALSWHLEHNLYPSPPPVVMEAARLSIEAFSEGDPERLISLPSIVTHRIYGSQAPASEIVEMLHLEPFITEEVQ